MRHLISLFLFILFISTISPAQQIFNVIPLQKGISGENLKLRIEFTDVSDIVKLKLFYKSSIDESFKLIEISPSRENFVIVTLPGEDVKAPEMEIFIEATDKSGGIKHYPDKAPNELLRIPITEVKAPGKIIVLSPEPGAVVRPEEVFISASLIEVESFAPEKSQVLFDRTDVTSMCIITSELVTFVPDNFKFPIKPGSHKVTIILKDTSEKVVASTSWNFTVLSPTEIAESERAFNYRSNFEIELRQEKAQSNSNFYVRGRANFTGSYSFFNLNTNLYLTSEEKATIQPQHRFLIEGNLLDWVKISYGDVYPNFSPLILSGYRVRGIYGKADLRYFQVEVVNGQIRRGIEGLVEKEIPIDSLKGETLPQNSVYDTTNRKILIYKYGTYERNLLAVKPAFKFKRNFELGFTYLVSQDDKASIRFGGNPQKNVVIGTNLILSLDNARTEFRAHGALSVRNENLKAASWTEADIDSLLKDTPSLRDNLKKYKPLIEKFVPLNQYIVPINPLALSSLAYEAGLNLNYFGNFLKIDYIFHGNEYLSFGQPYLRQDIQGFRIFDRLRFLKNQLFLTLRFENLNDNTKKQRDYTTKFINWEVSAMYSPLANLPTMSVTYAQNKSDNGIPLDSSRAFNLLVNKVSFDISYYFEYLFKNQVNISFSISGSDDRTRTNADFNNTNLSLSMFSNVNDNLRGNFQFGMYNSKFKKPLYDTTGRVVGTTEEKFNYILIGFGADYRFKNMRIWGNMAPSFGNLSRLYIYFGGEREIARNQSLNLNCNFLLHKSIDVVAYLTYRISF